MSDIFLHPGQCVVASAGDRIRTLLGSCVSVTLWHPERRVGAMSHALLGRRGGRLGQADDARYGDDALRIMLGLLERRGLARKEFQAKIFGGGDMFPGQACTPTYRVGHENGEYTRAQLAQAGIPIIAEHMYGFGHRKLMFDVSCGDVWVCQTPPIKPVPEHAPAKEFCNG
jgi:chemotaxis protein CheD